MKKSVFARAVFAGVLLLSLPTAAHAATEGGDYTPGVDGQSTLAGSEVVAVCENDVPWITYSVSMTDSSGSVEGKKARLVLSNGSTSTTIQLGALGADGTLSGSVLWPGASVATDGTPTDWPGWEFVDGEWVEANDEFAWTRGAISAKVVVNPEVSVALSYPPSDPRCSANPDVVGAPAAVDGESVLAVTGSDFDALPFVIGGSAVLLVGAGLLVASRRRRSTN